jgi:hypothetical protein
MCSFSYECVLALQIIMRMFIIEKFILIGPKLFNFDTQNISSCTAQGLVIYMNNKKKKEVQLLNETVNILRSQKKVYIDMVKIDTNDDYFQNQLHLLEKIIQLYVGKNYSESANLKIYESIMGKNNPSEDDNPENNDDPLINHRDIMASTIENNDNSGNDSEPIEDNGKVKKKKKDTKEKKEKNLGKKNQDFIMDN